MLYYTAQKKSSIELRQKQLNIETIELTEQTRGTNRIFTFNSQSKTTSLNGNISTSDIISEEWQALIKEVSEIDLSKISELQSPTTDRYTDKALISTIIINDNGKKYESSAFDAGRPPLKLLNLYKKLQELKGTPYKKNKSNFR